MAIHGLLPATAFGLAVAKTEGRGLAKTERSLTKTVDCFGLRPRKDGGRSLAKTGTFNPLDHVGWGTRG